MLRNQGVTNGKSEPHPLSGIFRGKERIKQLIEICIRDMRSRIGEGEHCFIILYHGGNRDDFWTGRLHIHCKNGVINDIDDYLVHLFRENRDQFLQAVLFDDLNVFRDLGSQQATAAPSR